MEKEYILLETYRIYQESKEKFIDRSFKTNKFYLVIEAILLIFCATTYDIPGLPLVTAICSLLGLLIAFMWWFNQDSYQFLIKIKYQDVIDKMEAQLPFGPFTEELKATMEKTKTRKIIVFNNVQKTLAFLILLVFVAFFMTSVLPLIKTFCFMPA